MRAQGYFEGRWRVNRRIRDERASAIFSFDGEMRFSPDKNGLALHEHGRLSGTQGAFEASQTLCWRFDNEGRVRVFFADGRFFHQFDSDAVLQGGVARVVHECAPDFYEGRYRFGANSWSLRWRARGPRKNYRSTSLVTRLSPIIPT